MHQIYGIVEHKAPAWNVNQWFNLQDNQQQPQVSDYVGKVLYLYGFQSWRPGCHSRGFPMLNTLQDHCATNEQVEFAAVQTVFEGFSQNTVATRKSRSDCQDFVATKG